MPIDHLRSVSFHVSTMDYVTSLSLLRLTRRVEFLEGSLHAISFKLNELEVENASHSQRYQTLLERQDILREALAVIRENA